MPFSRACKPARVAPETAKTGQSLLCAMALLMFGIMSGSSRVPFSKYFRSLHADGSIPLTGSAGTDDFGHVTSPKSPKRRTLISFAVRVRPLDSAVIPDSGDVRPLAVILPRMAKTPELARNQRVTGTERTKLGNELLKRYQKGVEVFLFCFFFLLKVDF